VGRVGGFLNLDNHRFTIYFAQYPIACFDSQERRVLPLPTTQGLR